MTDEEAYYHRLIGLGYRNSVLDAEIEFLKLEIQRLSAFQQKGEATRPGSFLIFIH